MPTPKQKRIILSGQPGFPAPACWLKADAITGKNDGDAISTWSDSSANGRNATQATGSKQPLYKTAILNGLPVVRFDGTDDFLAHSAGPIANGGLTLFSVVSIGSTPGATQYITDYNKASNYLLAMTLDATQFTAIANDGSNKTSATTVATGAHIWSNRATSGVNVTGYKDVTALTPAALGALSSPSGTAPALGSIRGGTSSWLAGDIGEFIVYDRALSNAEMAVVLKYLKAKWATP